MRNYISLIALIIANLFPIYGVLYLNWNISIILLLFWIETFIIGFYTFLKMVMAKKENKKGFKIPVEDRGEVLIKDNLIYIGLFVYMFLFYTGGLGLILFSILDLSIPLAYYLSLLLSFIFLFISHGVSHYFNYIKTEEYKRVSPEDLAAEPIKRLFIVHITVLIGAGLLFIIGEYETYALVILVILKIISDIFSHIYQHNKILPKISQNYHETLVVKNTINQKSNLLNIDASKVNLVSPFYEKNLAKAYNQSVKVGTWDKIKNDMTPQEVEYAEKYWN